jgi:hypothetical protein
MRGFQRLAIAGLPTFDVADDREIRQAPGDPRVMVRALVIGGCSPAEAGNVAAYVHGLHPAVSGWTAAQIQHMLFLRSLVETGRLQS